jgi:glycosyltransferase involved in cell wall biosynthesis
MDLTAETGVTSKDEGTGHERILVFVPMYNCAPQITRVIAQLAAPETRRLIDGVVCIDNRSSDGTAEAAEAALEGLDLPHRTLLRNCENYGLGGSHKVAIDFARTEGFDYLVVLHGDDQGSIADLVPHLRDGVHASTDFLLGARFMSGSRLEGYSRLRTVLNRVTNLIFSTILLRRIYDIGSGLNLFRVAAFENGFERRFADDLTFNLYLVFGIADQGLRMRFFPLTWREDDQVSNARLSRIARRVFRLLGLRILRPRSFAAGEHRDTPRDSYPSDVLWQRRPSP